MCSKVVKTRLMLSIDSFTAGVSTSATQLQVGRSPMFESHTYMRMWKWLVEKEGVRHGWRRIKAKYEKNHTWQVGKHRLFRLKELRIEYPSFRKPFNPFLGADPVTEPYVVDLYAAAWTGHHEYGCDWKPVRDEVWMEAEGRC